MKRFVSPPRVLRCAAVAGMTLLQGVTACAQQSAVWRDPSPHKTRFVKVDKDVQLEVLDWGGSGRPIVLLAGGGGTAHLFDDFALKLTNSNHVYGITRRGFGASTLTASGYDTNRLGDDVVSVIDSLKLDRPILVGESFGGAELSSIGSRYPNRVAGLVYLDAAYQYAFDNGKGASLEELLSRGVPQPPEPTGEDLASFPAFQAWYKRVLGVSLPEAELRQVRNPGANGRVGALRADPIAQMALVQMAIAGLQKYTDIRVPVLAIYAVPVDPGPWLTGNEDQKIRAAAEAFLSRSTQSTLKQAKSFEDGVPGARVVRLPHAMHLVFLSNEADVLREMLSFLETLN